MTRWGGCGRGDRKNYGVSYTDYILCHVNVYIFPQGDRYFISPGHVQSMSFNVWAEHHVWSCFTSKAFFIYLYMVYFLP
jgi:hypothetical protein